MVRGYKSGIATGLVLSAGAMLLGPLWRPALARWGRPAAKGAIRGALATYEVARGRLTELGERTQDLVAEVSVERAAERLRDVPDPDGTP